MATSSIIQQLLNEPHAFQAFVDNSMKLSSYQAEWKNENVQVEYCAQKVYSAIVAQYAAATVGSVIAQNAGKPVHELPTAAQLTGEISRMADEWQLSNDKLQEFYYLEGRYNDRSKLYNEATRDAEWQKLIAFLFDPFEKAVIAPHKRIDMLYFEGLFNGSQTVSLENNTKSNISWTYELGIKKFSPKVAWSDAENATPITDIEENVNALSAKGKTVRVIRMSKRQFREMCATKQVKGVFTQVGTKARVSGIELISLAAVNEYFESVQLPTISIEKDRFVSLADGTSYNLTRDGRVVYQCADTLAVIKASDPLEAIDPLPYKQYALYDDNLVGFWRSERGRFVDYEMYATPVFTGKDNFAILDTTEAAK
jgi:hypothetical protein